MDLDKIDRDRLMSSFDQSKFHTILTADQVKVGDQVLCGDTLHCIIRYYDDYDPSDICTITEVHPDDVSSFVVDDKEKWPMVYVLESSCSENYVKSLEQENARLRKLIRKCGNGGV